MFKRLLGAATCLAIITTAAACGSDDGAGDGSGAVVVEDPWARTSPAGVTAGAAYMVLRSEEDDRLVGASVDPSVAGTVEIHETVAADDASGATDSTSMGGMDSSMASTDTGMGDMGAMTMRPIDGLDLPAGDDVVLEPGGYHVMLLDLPEPLEDGDTFNLTLEFEQAGEVSVDVPVQDSAP